jgi:hypothetical protein
MSWYETGYSGINREEDRIATLSGPFRVWIPPGKSLEMVFVDDEPVCIYEHQWKANGSWRNWTTCLQGISDDVVCCKDLGEKTRSYVGYITTVQCTETTDKKGNKYNFELQLLGAKLKTLKKFRRKKEERGALAMTRFRVTREDDKSPSCGDEFEFLKEVTDPDKLFEVANYKGKKLSELWEKAESNPESMARLKRTFQLAFDSEGKLLRRVVPFNYMELLKPMEAADLRKRLNANPAQDADGDGGGTNGGGGGGDDVPF